MKLSGIYCLGILACMGCKNSSVPVPGQDVRYPGTVASIADALSKRIVISAPLARPGSVRGGLRGFKANSEPAYQCKVDWAWIESNEAGDVYEFSINLAVLPTTQPAYRDVTISSGVPVREVTIIDPDKSPTTQPQVTKRVTYRGDPVVLYEDENVRIAIHSERSPK